MKIMLSCFFKTPPPTPTGKQRKELKKILRWLIVGTILLMVLAGLYVNYNDFVKYEELELNKDESIHLSDANTIEQRNVSQQQESIPTNKDTESDTAMRMITIQSPFGLCSTFAKVACEVTILLEEDNLINNIDFSISIESKTESIMDILCKDTLMTNASRIATDGTTDKTITLPVCVQYYNNSFSIPIILKDEDTSSMRKSKYQIELIQSIESNTQLQSLVTSNSNVRVLPLKYVDFPFF